MRFSFFWKLLLPVPFLLGGVSGCGGSKSDADKAVRQNAPAPLADTAENREVMAEKLIQVYPMEEFAADTADEATRIVGKHVVEQARAKLKSQMGAAQFHNVRKAILVKHFTAGELQKLCEVYGAPEGKSLMRKMYLYNEDWREFLAPVLVSVLSNSP